MRKKIHETIRDLRLRNGLSTKEFAYILGYRGKPASLDIQVKRWECRARPVPEQAKRLIMLLDAYGIPETWIRKENRP